MHLEDFVDVTCVSLWPKTSTVRFLEHKMTKRGANFSPAGTSTSVSDADKCQMEVMCADKLQPSSQPCICHEWRNSDVTHLVSENPNM